MTGQPPFDLGVIRDVIRFTHEAVDQGPLVEFTGSLIAHLPPDADSVPFIGEVVFYTLDAGRLRDMLALAAGGADIDGLMMSLDAAVLLSHQHREDDDDDGGDDGA